MALKSLRKVRRTQKLGQNRFSTLLDKQGREIHDQDKIIERNDSEQSAIIHTDQEEVTEITSWAVEAALQHMKNGIATGNDHINIDTLKAGENTISKTLAKLYTQYLSERRIPTAWKKAKMAIISKKGNKKDLKNYIPIYLLSNIKYLRKYYRKGYRTHSTKTIHESKLDSEADTQRQTTSTS